MPTVYGPHIPHKENPTEQQNRVNWLEVQRWAARLNEQLGTGGSLPWITRTTGDFSLPVGASGGYPVVNADVNGKYFLNGLAGGAVYKGGPTPDTYFSTDALLSDFSVNIIAAGAYQVHMRCELLLPADHAALWLTGYGYNTTDKWGLDSVSIPTEALTPLYIHPCVYTGTFYTHTLDNYSIFLWEWLQAPPTDYAVKVRNAAIHIVRLSDAPDIPIES